MASITLNFDDEAQRDRFNAYLSSPLPSSDEGFAAQIWGLAVLAQAELDDGDTDGAMKTLIRVAEIASTNCK